MGRALILAAVMLIYGCDSTVDQLSTVDRAKQSLEAVLPYKDNVEYRDVREYPGEVVCGEVNAMSRWGDGAGFRYFIVDGSKVSVDPGDDERAIFCSADPAAGLEERFGIGPLNPQNTSLLTVHKQMKELDSALQQYFADYHDFPSNAAGLQVLLEPKKGGSQSAYLDRIPEDPWERPYIYEKPRQLHGAAKVYKLHTLGRDGAPGGRGEDADIGNGQLKYLDHIAKL